MAEIAYCMKCKKKQTMKDTEQVTMKNGRKAMKGKCTVCGTGMYKILGKYEFVFQIKPRLRRGAVFVYL